MDKNDKEKKLLYNWAVKNCSSYRFQQIDKSKESYFMQRECMDEDSSIREYAFEDLPEFMEELNALWGDDEVMKQIKKVIGIAAIKNKISSSTVADICNDSGSNSDNIEKLPMYIYNF